MQEPQENSSIKQFIVPSGPAPRSTRVLYLEPMGAESFSGGDHSDLVKHWQVIRRKLPFVIGIIVVGTLLGLAWSHWQKPVYQAHVTLEIENPRENAFSLRNSDLPLDGGLSPAESYLPTQILILQSRTLRMRAGAKFGANQYPVRVKIRVEPSSRIVQILCESPNAKFSADYANAMANEYVESDMQAHWDAFNRSREWLAHQLDETRAKLQKSEVDLQEYGKASNLIFTGHESDDKTKLRQIETQVVQAEAERAEKQSAYQIASTSPPDWVPQVMDNPSLTEYKNQLALLRKQIAELLPQYLPEHYKIKRLQAQINEVQATFNQERANVLARIRSDYHSAVAREKLLTAAYQKQAQVVAVQTQRAINYSILERDADTNRQLYASLLQRSKEADASAMRGSNVRIVDSAEPPTTTYSPSFRKNALVGGALGLLLSVGIVLILETFDRSFKFPGDLSSHLHLPELGVIPAGELRYGNGNTMFGKRQLFPSLAAISEDPGAQKIELATWRDKSSMIAESFRNALTSIQCSSQGARPRIILVTSAIRGEGKTTIVSNLGIALAEINQRVLLIDGDMRKPRLHTVFNVSNDWGLSDILREKSPLRESPLEALTKHTELPDLGILTSGPGTNNIANLLYSHRMLELLQRLRGEFDAILIDTPPMLDISDARILGRLADAVVLVFRAGKTSRESAQAASRRLTDDGISVLGTILNGWDLRNLNGYRSNHYYQTA